jgi:alpha-L-fucosidase
MKGSTLYAFVQGWPGKEAIITSLGSASPHTVKITNARMLGHDENLKITQQADGLHVALPNVQPTMANIGITLKLSTT